MITKFKLFRSQLRNKKINDICKKYHIKNYVINLDGSISVNGNVRLMPISGSWWSLKKMPLKFKDVSGSFSCSYNQLTSLEGCPKTVGGDFNCSFNKLTSLNGCPERIDGDFNCSHNQLTSLKGCPERIDGDLFCSSNKITSFDGLPEFWEKDIHMDENPLDEIYYKIFNYNPRCIEWIIEYDVIQGDKVSKHRLEEVFHTLNLEVPKDIYLKNYKLI